MSLRRAARKLSALRRDRRGAMGLLAAGTLLVLMLLASLSVDLGMLYWERQRLQGAVDRAALKAVTDPVRAGDLAQAVLLANIPSDRQPRIVAVTHGRYPPAGYTLASARSLAPASRFAAAASEPNAIRVTARSTAPLLFARLLPGASGDVGASALAINKPVTQITTDTQFASLDLTQIALVNPLLSALTGNDVALNPGDYVDLAGEALSILGFLDRVIDMLGLADRAYEEALATAISLPEILDAVEGAAPGLAPPLAALRPALAGLPSVAIGSFLGLDPEDPLSAAGATVDALSLVTAALAAQNTGQSLVIGQNLTLAGTGAQLWAHVVEPPRFSAIGGVGTQVRTAQIRLFIKVTVLNALPLPALGSLATVQLPLYLELGSGDAVVTDIACAGPTATAGRVSVRATPGLVSTYIGSLDPPTMANNAPPAVGEATLLSVLGKAVTVTGQAGVTVGGSASQLTFTAPFTADNYQVAPLAGNTGQMAADLAADIELDVSVLGLGLGIGVDTLPAEVGAIIGTLAPALDGLIGTVQALFGLDVGYMKVADTMLRCSRPLLAGN